MTSSSIVALFLRLLSSLRAAWMLGKFDAHVLSCGSYIEKLPGDLNSTVDTCPFCLRFPGIVEFDQRGKGKVIGERRAKPQVSFWNKQDAIFQEQTFMTAFELIVSPFL
jgi:hypothetical protein